MQALRRRQPASGSETRASRDSIVSFDLSAASVTAGSMRIWPLPALSDSSMVCLSTLAMRRATTWAWRRPVPENTSRIEPSPARQAKSTLRTSRLTRRAASRLARRSISGGKLKRARDRPMPRSRVSVTALSRSRRKARTVNRPVWESSSPLASRAASWRLSRASNACWRTSGNMRSTIAGASPSRRSRLGRRERSMVEGTSPRTPTGKSRNRLSSESALKKVSTARQPKPSPIMMPSTSRLARYLAAVSTARAPISPTRSPNAVASAG